MVVEMDPERATWLLALAARRGWPAAVDAALNAGADAEGGRWGTEWDGVASALQAAAANGHVAVLKVFREHGAPLDAAMTPRHQTALHHAVLGGHSATVEYLLESGADVDARNSQSHTPLYLAADLGDVPTISILLRHGANVNAVADDAYRLTPLHMAVENGSQEAVAALLAGGASPRLRDGNGQTPLDCAEKSHNAALRQLFERPTQRVNRRSRSPGASGASR